MIKYEITRVGLPITNKTVTAEFIDIINKLKQNKKWVGILTSNDEKNAPAGYAILHENNVDLIQLNIWDNSRDPIKATLNLLRQIHTMHSEQIFERVVLFTPGSPYIDDAITKVLLSAYDDIEVIDTKGAPQIAADLISEMTGLKTDIRNYYDDFILNKNPSIDKSKATIFSCLQQIYNVNLFDVVSELKPDRIITVNIGESILAKEYSYEEMLNCCNEIAISETSYTFGFIFDK